MILYTIQKNQKTKNLGQIWDSIEKAKMGKKRGSKKGSKNGQKMDKKASFL